jgi:hypothetical protein
MAEINRQMWNQGADIQVVAVPRLKSLNGEAVPE